MSQTVDGHKISDKGTSLPVIFLGILASIQVADPVVASLALVKATKALNFSPSMQAIAASISTLALAATVVPTGVLADKIGRRKVLILSLLLTAVGDGIAAAAPNSYVFLVGRAIAGIGLGGVFACSFGFIRSMVTDKALAPALGIFAAMAALPLFVIMPLGSALAGVNWRLAFVLIVVLALIGAALCFPLLPDLAPVAEGVKKQYWGLTALGVGIVGLLIGLSGAAKSLTAPSTLLPLAIGILGLGLFALIESKVAVPTYPVSLFKSPLFLVGAIGGFAWNAVSAVATLMSSNLWQYVDGFTPLQASIRQLAGIVATIIASVIAGRVMGKGKSSVGVLVVGGFITMVGLALTGVFAGDSSGLLFLAMLSLAFFGCGVMTVPRSEERR
ncbi:MAG: hypothetical protein QG597_3536, partial [Actinomycetota bacterium]|nr:hypothetical protein [Actinomycetota bacterium]